MIVADFSYMIQFIRVFQKVIFFFLLPFFRSIPAASMVRDCDCLNTHSIDWSFRGGGRCSGWSKRKLLWIFIFWRWICWSANCCLLRSSLSGWQKPSANRLYLPMPIYLIEIIDKGILLWYDGFKSKGGNYEKLSKNMSNVSRSCFYNRHLELPSLCMG